MVYSLQALRAVAAALVVCFHGAWWLNHSGIAMPMATNVLCIGVDIFFVLSGYVMMMLADHGDFGPLIAARFLGRRLARIVPSYWVATTVFAVLLPGLVVLPNLMKSYLFIPFFGESGVTEKPFLGAGWTLIYEMAFYAIVSLSLLLRVRPVFRLAFVALALVSVWTADQLAGGTIPLLHHYGDPVIFEFGVGGALYFGLQHIQTSWVVKAAAALSIAVAVMLVALNLDGWGNNATHGAVGWIAVSAMTCIGFVLSESIVSWRRAKTVLLVGDASYALYLLNWYLLTFVDCLVPWKLLGQLPVWLASGLYLAAALVFCGAAANVVYQRAERPTTKWLNGRLGGT